MKKDACKLSRWQILKGQLNNLDLKAFKELLQQYPEAMVIDVRTPDEYASGHLQGAINIDYFSEDFWDRIEALAPDRPYLIYCRSSRRSIRVCTLMKNGGFTKIYNLDGGLKEWPAAIQKPIHQL